MSQSLQGARNAVQHLATLAKTHGEAVEAYCSEQLHFTHTSELRSHLSTSIEANSIKLALGTLQSVENTAWTLQPENQEHVQFLKSAELVDTSNLRRLTQIYGHVAALNFKKNILERLAALDRAINADILEMHKAWLVSKLQADRIPLEADANLVIGINTLLSETRPSYGWQPASGISNEEIQGVAVLFSQQFKEVHAMRSPQDVEGVTAAYERANSYNQKLQYMLPVLKERLHAVLQSQPLSKEEAATASKKMEGIAGTGLEQGEELFKFCQTVYADIGGKPEEVALDVGVGKALLNILGSKTKSSIDDQVKAVQCPEGDIVCYVRKYFATPARDLEYVTKEYLVRSHVILESTKKPKKYKLDKDVFGSSALDKKTDIRVEMATNKRLVALLGLRFRYYSRLAAEIEEYEKIVTNAFSLPFRRATSPWNHLQEQFDTAKANISNSASHEGIPQNFGKMLQISLRIQTWVLDDRLRLFNEPVDYPPNDAYSADLY
ncbi:hypothetical protein, conserved [Eimeria maxima]|uniref:Uncharacterized protein n=1 Tax=Eimeria maxima TaxID=5804 RepID=U6MAK7_EIMMA|nr:hypothetical protein, conserved [Eimeria maxima]CDJ60078.1 hypothetical protein, conserved [Eimeria maxima]